MTLTGAPQGANKFFKLIKIKNMKTAKEILLFILFGLIIAWLVSCGSSDKDKKRKLVTMQQTIKFDLDLLADQNKSLQKRLDETYTLRYIAYAVNGLPEDQKEEKRKKASDAEKTYKELLNYKTIVTVKMVLLKIKYDSLSIEILKF